MIDSWIETMIKDIEADSKSNENTDDKKIELSAEDIEKVADKVIEKLNNNSFDIETKEQNNDDEEVIEESEEE